MKRYFCLTSIICAMLLAGCQGGGSPASGANSPSPGGKPKVTGVGDAGTTGSGTPAVTVVPEELKTEAYHWLGLGNEKPIRYLFTDQTGATSTGEQSFKLDSVADGKAIYKLTRTEGLGDKLGDEDWSLEKDGVFIIGNSKMGSGFRDQQANADLKPGSSWVSSAKMEYGGADMEQNLKLSVVGMKHIKTKAGEYDALMVTAKGTLKSGETTSRVEANAWYVKDKGMVKNVLTVTTDKKPQVITIEETK